MADLIFVSAPYSAPFKHVIETRMAIYARSMALFAQRGDNVVGVLWMHFALEYVPSLGNDYATWEAYTKALLGRCDRLRVLKVHGWEESPGVKDEIAYAFACGIPVEYVEVPQD